MELREVLGVLGISLALLTTIVGLASVLVTNLIVVAPVLLLARRWRLPFGTVISIPGYNSTKPVPVLDRGGKIKGNRHLVYPKDTPLNNLLLNMFDLGGVPEVQGFGDSTGRLTGI